ncbi:hypothetical protein ACOSQ4_005726 [Xanthoceras sorbifolium]
MAGEAANVQKRLNPEAPEFFPTRLKRPSCTSNGNSLHCPRAPPVLYFQNPNNYFDDHLYYCSPPPLPSPYLHTYTITSTPLSLYTNPNYPTQPYDYCLVGPAKVDPEVAANNKGYRRKRRGKKRYCYRSFWRRNGEGRDSQGKFNNGKKHHCCRRNNIDLSNYSSRNVQYGGVVLPKQRHPVVAVQEDGGDTTVMIRNIPNRFTREMLMDFLDDHCMVENQKAKQLQNGEAESIIVSAFDFLYLPMDFESGVNKGYAFVNFTDPRAAWKFYLAAHNLSWGAFLSNKICQIASARLQGKEELERHFESINFPCVDKHEYLPVCFSPARDGSREPVNQRTVGRCTKPKPKSGSSAEA